MRAKFSSAILARYNRVMGTTVAAVVVIAGLLAWLQASGRIDAARRALLYDMQERAVALDAILGASADGVRALQAVADMRLRTITQSSERSVLLEALLVSANSGGEVSMDHPPPPWRLRDVGNLTGTIAEPDGTLLRELEMALALNSTFLAVLANNPNSVAVYYISARGFINLMPWLPSSEYRFEPATLTRDYYTLGLPAANPDRQVYWTPAYVDDSGRGMMITVGAPIYEGSSFRGIVGLDITLSELARFVDSWPQTNPGRLMLVSNAGQVLAESGTAEAPAQPVRRFADVLPAVLRADAASILGRDGAALEPMHGIYIGSVPLKGAPLRLMLIEPAPDLFEQTLRGGMLLVAALAVGLGLLLLVASRLVRREFVGPAQSLVSFIEEESRGPALAMPEVHPAWRPWFETIRNVFNAHTQLVSLRQELDVARRMQQSILPTRFPVRPDVQMYARMLPAKEVGGDFYDYFWLDACRLGLVVADVSGKGVPAALFMAVARTLMRATAANATGPAECLRLANAALAKDNEQLTFVTVFYAILDTRTGLLRYSNGGHCDPAMLRPGAPAELLPHVGGMALGVIEDEEFEEGEMILPPGTSLFLYTDGVTEAFDPAGGLFGEDGLLRVVSASSGEPEALTQAVVAAVATFSDGEPQSDDVTCLAIHFSAPAEEP